tara:strand:+ start:2724 stop:4103 length:1380 start_codon:yes stop_codon:yes gene_type:complete
MISTARKLTPAKRAKLYAQPRNYRTLGVESGLQGYCLTDTLACLAAACLTGKPFSLPLSPNDPPATAPELTSHHAAIVKDTLAQPGSGWLDKTPIDLCQGIGQIGTLGNNIQRLAAVDPQYIIDYVDHRAEKKCSLRLESYHISDLPAAKRSNGAAPTIRFSHPGRNALAAYALVTSGHIGHYIAAWENRTKAGNHLYWPVPRSPMAAQDWHYLLRWVGTGPGYEPENTGWWRQNLNYWLNRHEDEENPDPKLIWAQQWHDRHLGNPVETLQRHMAARLASGDPLMKFSEVSTIGLGIYPAWEKRLAKWQDEMDSCNIGWMRATIQQNGYPFCIADAKQIGGSDYYDALAREGRPGHFRPKEQWWRPTSTIFIEWRMRHNQQHWDPWATVLAADAWPDNTPLHNADLDWTPAQLHEKRYAPYSREGRKRISEMVAGSETIEMPARSSEKIMVRRWKKKK